MLVWGHWRLDGLILKVSYGVWVSLRFVIIGFEVQGVGCKALGLAFRA